MSIFFAPALISLLFKLFVLAYVLRGGKVSVVFLSLITVFAIHNAIEILGYLQFANGEAVSAFFRMYYVATVFVVLYILLHGISVSKIENTLTTTVLISVATLLSGLILFTDLVIAGHYSIGYSMTAIKGSFYWLFASYILILLISNFGVIFYGHRNAESRLDSVRCMHSLYALTPIMLVFLLAIILKIVDIGINATGLAPIATALFLGIILKTESKHKLSDLRRLMPLSLERETTNNFMDLLDGYLKNSSESNVYKNLQAGIEKEIIHYSLQKCDNNVTQTAKMMGLKNRSTLYSMMSRLEIDVSELKKEPTNRKTRSFFVS